LAQSAGEGGLTMLTQSEIEAYFESERIAESNSPVGYDLQPLRDICDQAIMAIELQMKAGACDA